MAVLSVTTSTASGDSVTQSNDTYEVHQEGSQSEVTTMMSAGGNISTATLPDDMASDSFSVTRGGSEQFVSDASELKPTDLVNVSGMMVEWSTVQSMGLAPSVHAEIQASNAQQAFKTQGIGEQSHGDNDGYDEAPEGPATPTSTLMDNIMASVSQGDMGPNTAANIELLSDQAEMAGVGIEDMLGGFEAAFNQGGFDSEILSALNLSENQANDALNNLKANVSSDVAGYIGDGEFKQMETWAGRYPEMADAVMELSMKHVTGNASRANWKSLWKQAVDAYGDRL